MQYVVSDTDPDVGDGTQGTMDVTFTASETAGFVGLGFTDELGCMVESRSIIGIPQYSMIVKYDLKLYAEKKLLPDEQKKLMDGYVEAVDGGIVIKFKKFLVEEGGNRIIVDGHHNFIYEFYDTVGEGYGSNRGKSIINISLSGSSKVHDPNQGKWSVYDILEVLAWEFLILLAVGDALLQNFLPPGPTWLNIHEYCNILNCLFTITDFAL